MYFLFSLCSCGLIIEKKNNFKTELNSSHTIALSKGTIFAKNADFLQKNAGISKIKGVLVTKRYIFWNYVCMCTYVPKFKFLT